MSEFAQLTPRFSRVVLAGMMGSGKTVVGRKLARYLGWPLIDTDAEIVRRAGMSIPEIFAQEGEAGFRVREREVVREIAPRRQVIIATGGGVLLSEENRHNLHEGALLVHLRAEVSTLAARLRDKNDRPLLDGPDPAGKLNEIYRERAHIYERLPVQVVTDGRAPAAIAQEILAHLFSGQAALNEDRFSVQLGTGALAHLPERIAQHRMSPPYVVLVDRNVLRLSEGWLRGALEPVLKQGVLIPVRASERSKSLGAARRLWSELHRIRAERSSGIVVIGGGVLSDLGGFIASTYKRGLPLVLVPTTLLAQVDAAIGGKTGINFGGSKNMVGSFYLAKETLLDPLFLLTLPARQLRSGLAEVIKAALLDGAGFFEFLEENLEAVLQRRLDILQETVRRAAEIKIRIVLEDFREESGRRMLLNLGHTFGHAFEALSRYRLLHGEAVAIGLVKAAQLARIMGLSGPELVERIERLLRRAKLPTRAPDFSPEAVLSQIAQDKKRLHNKVNLVLPRRIGQVEVVPLNSDAPLRQVLSK